CLTQAGAFATQLTAARCEVVEFHKRKGNDFRLPTRIAASARQHRLDILHARGWPALVETALAARLARVRRTVYGFHGKTMADLQGWGLKRRLLQRLAIRWYDHAVTLNPLMQMDFAAESGLSASRIRVIANGVDIDTFYPRDAKAALRAEFGIPQDRFVIGNVARLDPVKNHEVILRTIARLRSQEGGTPYFVLVGEGPHRAVLEHEVEQLGLKGDVQFLGYSQRIPELLNCMDLYIQSSFYEGFSNTIIEAMACELPLLATHVGGTADVFPPSLEGIYFRPNDEETLAVLILQMRQDSCLSARVARQMRRHVVEHFSVHMMVRRYEALYLELMEKN
ncbi:MAG: glycosyltransferase, partial [Deltaproteobacteria bacterium]|nr:glycosyltransferase [Deltaproteobacteria bacterium]